MVDPTSPLWTSNHCAEFCRVGVEMLHLVLYILYTIWVTVMGGSSLLLVHWLVQAECLRASELSQGKEELWNLPLRAGQLSWKAHPFHTHKTRERRGGSVLPLVMSGIPLDVNGSIPPIPKRYATRAFSAPPRSDPAASTPKTTCCCNSEVLVAVFRWAVLLEVIILRANNLWFFHYLFLYPFFQHVLLIVWTTRLSITHLQWLGYM